MLAKNLIDIVKSWFYFPEVPTDESGRAAYDAGFEDPDAPNPYRKGSRLYKAHELGKVEGVRYQMSLW